MWQDEFKHRLRIRFKTHHAKCSQCLKHRAIIRKLGHLPSARRSQVELLQRHLRRQHSDRKIYWECRAQSRLESVSSNTNYMCGILDSMDAAKHAWPRSHNMLAKDFSSFNRPRLTSTTMILHGHSVVTALSPSNCSSNSSRTAEIVSYSLTLASKSVDLRPVTLSLQGDNCPRELKNNTLLRVLAGWVARSRLKAAELSFLTSGHSHEDIDAHFSNIRSWINSNGEMHTPESFRSHIQNYFNDPTHRPYEKQRQVVMMNCFRDWNLDFITYIFRVSIGFCWGAYLIRACVPKAASSDPGKTFTRSSTIMSSSRA